MKEINKKIAGVFSALALCTATAVFTSCGDVVNDMKDDIEREAEQANTEAYFRLYGLFKDEILSSEKIGGKWDCATIELKGTKGYFLGKDSDDNYLIKGSYFYMEKPSSGKYYKEPDNGGSYTDDYQLPDDFSGGELWLNVQDEWKNGKWETYTDGGSLRDGLFYVAKIDIPNGDKTIKSENVTKKTKDDYDRRKADAHDYATHMFHYALEYLHPSNKYKPYDDITKDWFEEEYPERKIIAMMDKLEAALDSDSAAAVQMNDSKKNNPDARRISIRS